MDDVITEASLVEAMKALDRMIDEELRRPWRPPEPTPVSPELYYRILFNRKYRTLAALYVPAFRVAGWRVAVIWFRLRWGELVRRLRTIRTSTPLKSESSRRRA